MNGKNGMDGNNGNDGNNGVNVNLLWVHGWGMSSRIWGDISALFPDFTHHYFSYEGCDTIEEVQASLRSKMNFIEGSWIIIGWSLGSMLALELWMEQLEQGGNVYTGTSFIKAIVVIAGTLSFVDKERSRGWPKRSVERMKQQLALDPAGTLQQFTLSMFSDSDHQMQSFEETKQWLLNNNESNSNVSNRMESNSNESNRMESNNNESNSNESNHIESNNNGLIGNDSHHNLTDFTNDLLHSGLTYLMETDLRERWANVSQKLSLPIEKGAAKLLWLHGENDPICPLGAMPELPLINQTIFPQTGHLPFVMVPELFYERLRSFLDGYVF